MHPENLHVNQWIVITDTYQDEVPMPSFLFPMMAPSRSRTLPVDGRPLQIKAISLPFLCVTDGQYRYPLDTRYVTVRLLNKAYVEAMRLREVREETGGYISLGFPPPQHLVISESAWAAGPPKKEDPHPRSCPMCGALMVERLINAGTEESTWIMVCKQCGFQGTIPRDGEGA